MEKVNDTFLNSLPSCLLPQELHIYKIPIIGGKDFVYMKPNSEYAGTHVPTIIATEPFLRVWKDAPKFFVDPPFFAGKPYAETPEIWHMDRKLQKGHAKECFSYGINNPVPLSVIDTVYNHEIYLIDGITRLLYLLIHDAKSFPIMCPRDHSDKLAELAGV
jgi:hypothetical protein